MLDTLVHRARAGAERLWTACRMRGSMAHQRMTALTDASQALLRLQVIVEALFWPRPPIKKAICNLLDEIRLARMTDAAAPQFAALRGSKGLLLHLGCGMQIKDGWVNLDIDGGSAPVLPSNCSPQTRFISHDLRSGVLPLDDESCEFIYSSHFFEHLEYNDGVRLMRDCHRVLRLSGTFRAALPDFEKLFRAYIDRNEEHFNLYNILDVYPDRPPETITMCDHINLGVYEFGHKCIYDEEKACRLLRHLGFASAEITPFREGIDPPSEIRRRYSFYVEARK
jgi:predicted SAM-dependent methyltransferase